MKKWVLLCLLMFYAFAEKLSAQEEKIYRYNWKADIPIKAVSGGLTALGFIMLQKKENLDRELVLSLGPEDVNAFDRSAVNNIATPGIRTMGEIFMFAPIALPFLNFADKDARREFWTITGLYLEAFAISGAIYGMSAALIDRKRPYVFNEERDINKRTSKFARNSFIGGHLAVTATASFFAAKVFHDYHPDSKWRFPIWIAAAAMPVVTGYARYADGQHFMTDLVAGYLVGAGSSLLVLQLHKADRKRLQRVSISPWYFYGKKGMHFSYAF